MKYIVILGDGMADMPVAELDNKTPLQYCNKPNIDYLAKHGQVGLVKTVPDGIAPGSDSANLSVMGYNPKIYYSGRSPLEAVSMGIKLSDTDTTLRCNLVTLSNDEKYENKIMLDYSSDEISTPESSQLVAEINNAFKNDSIEFFSGISYRHCMIWKNGPLNLSLAPPHDILNNKIANFLPNKDINKMLLALMIKSHDILKDHPVNKQRVSKGLNPANSIWLWGEGRKPNIPKFYDKYKLNGSVISAVDLIKGIGICAGLKVVNVEGATGNIHTNFIGKAKAAINELKSGQDFVYIHIEAPDECGHRFEIQNKVKSIELIDNQIVKPLLDELEEFDDYKILILPDHPTPLHLRTHTSDPVPFLIYRNNKLNANNVINCYDEFEAQKTGLFFGDGYRLMDYFLD